MDPVIIKPAVTDEELRQASDLMAKAHFSDYYAGADHVGGVTTGYPGFKREHVRIAVAGGHVAAALLLTTDTIRIGEARLRMGGFGCVTTAREHRRRGIISLVMDDAMKYLRDHGHHAAMLFGIPDFYHRWGFATALAEHSAAMDIREAEAAADVPFRMRGAKPGDIPVMQKMHAANDQETACSLIRTAAHMTSRWDRWRNVHVLLNTQGRVIAYFRGARVGAEYVVDEAGVSGHEACGAVLRSAARLAHGECVGRMKFLAPPSHPLIRHLLAYRADHDMRTDRDGGGMVALVNVPEAMESMIPEWESRLRQSPLAGESAEVTLLLDRQPWRVRARRGAVDVTPGAGRNKVSLSAAELVQVFTGYRHLEEVLQSRRRIITAEGMALLAALFPKRVPYVWMMDRF